MHKYFKYSCIQFGVCGGKNISGGVWSQILLLAALFSVLFLELAWWSKPKQNSTTWVHQIPTPNGDKMMKKTEARSSSGLSLSEYTVGPFERVCVEFFAEKLYLRGMYLDVFRCKITITFWKPVVASCLVMIFNKVRGCSTCKLLTVSEFTCTVAEYVRRYSKAPVVLSVVHAACGSSTPVVSLRRFTHLFSSTCQWAWGLFNSPTAAPIANNSYCSTQPTYSKQGGGRIINNCRCQAVGPLAPHTTTALKENDAWRYRRELHKNKKKQGARC